MLSLVPLQPANDDSPRSEIDVVPAQIASLADPKAMPIDHQSDEPIPMTVAIALQGGEELVDLCLC